jgi:5-methylcytosine-specific restriction endonuclease McrA
MVLLTNGSPLGQESSFCFYCGRPIRRVPGKSHVCPPEDSLTRDHVLPKSHGGDSVVFACWGCNQAKRDMTLDEFRVVRAFNACLIPLPAYKFAAEERT